MRRFSQQKESTHEKTLADKWNDQSILLGMGARTEAHLAKMQVHVAGYTHKAMRCAHAQ